jgi:phage-related protein (TIGR01555 family)
MGEPDLSRRRKHTGDRSVVPAGAVTEDNFSNFAARLGVGTGADNLLAQGSYSLNRRLTREWRSLDAMYRTSWIVGKVVDAVAEDMTRGGIEIVSELDPDGIDSLHAALDDLEVLSALADGIRWGRLYGGAIGVLMIDGQDTTLPLRPESVRHGAVGPGAFRGIRVFGRWEVIVDTLQVITDMGPQNGLPEFYTISNADSWNGKKIHHSRIIRFTGPALPYYERLAELHWGMSVVEQMFDRLLAFDSTTHGAANLVFKAHLRRVGVDGLRQILAAGGKAEENMIKMFQLIRMLQSNEGLTITDKNDEFDTHSYTFTGLDDILMAFGMQISGATGIPLVRLFGQSPKGFNSTGDADVRTYYDMIAAQQRRVLRPAVKLVLDILGRSVLGGELPEDFSFNFHSLWQMSEKERSEVATQDATTISTLHTAGIIDRPTALKELRQGSRSHGRFSNITPEDIDAAEKEAEAPPMPAPVAPGAVPPVKAGEEGDPQAARQQA